MTDESPRIPDRPFDVRAANTTACAMPEPFDPADATSLYRGMNILAPMVRSGTLPMRILALQYGADRVYGEELVDHSMLRTVRVENHALGTVDYVDSTGKVIFQTCARERGRVIFQIGTSDPERAVRVAKMVHRDVAAIDLNMGCPKPFSTSGGMGSALLDPCDRAVNILKALKAADLSCPVTCKIRFIVDAEEREEVLRAHTQARNTNAPLPQVLTVPGGQAEAPDSGGAALAEDAPAPGIPGIRSLQASQRLVDTLSRTGVAAIGIHTRFPHTRPREAPTTSWFGPVSSAAGSRAAILLKKILLVRNRRNALLPAPPPRMLVPPGASAPPGPGTEVSLRQRRVYSLVAGHVEPGERAEAAAARETFEETGVSLVLHSDLQSSLAVTQQLYSDHRHEGVHDRNLARGVPPTEGPDGSLEAELWPVQLLLSQPWPAGTLSGGNSEVMLASVGLARGDPRSPEPPAPRADPAEILDARWADRAAVRQALLAAAADFACMPPHLPLVKPALRAVPSGLTRPTAEQHAYTSMTFTAAGAVGAEDPADAFDLALPGPHAVSTRLCSAWLACFSDFDHYLQEQLAGQASEDQDDGLDVEVDLLVPGVRHRVCWLPAKLVFDVFANDPAVAEAQDTSGWTWTIMPDPRTDELTPGPAAGGCLADVGQRWAVLAPASAQEALAQAAGDLYGPAAGAAVSFLASRRALMGLGPSCSHWAARAGSLLAWHSRARFCTRCGSPMVCVSHGRARRCAMQCHRGAGGRIYARVDPISINMEQLAGQASEDQDDGLDVEVDLLSRHL
ncbi:hypothetical protein H696_00165 [Fonticula alba]|uniref:Nudix hydrolase domain-containing protein n=1 Tax=Fonticula alba TaxID=691883 RepID=A0A058ZDY5_FONAL|nr:hypothetical protein H696_00165 [Fonticula alba]KCV72574.1 hypothetical protein H696_00165 [Fonticula alba]|eukprot:XP_009492275.1 hypothetical protein H696_00165 [Fonticula alba]